MGDVWIERHRYDLKRLKKANLTVEVERWEDVMKHDKYSVIRNQLEEYYNTNSEYRAKIDALAFKHQEKVILNIDKANATREYLLEEVAVLATLPNRSAIIYPASSLPEAVKYSFLLLECGPSYVGYEFFETPKEDPAVQLHDCIMAVKMALKRAGVQSFEDQMAYVMAVLSKSDKQRLSRVE